MVTTKEAYLERCPRSYLARSLRATDWEMDAFIIIGSGIISTVNENSNLSRDLVGTTGEFVTGGKKLNQSEGRWYAVRR